MSTYFAQIGQNYSASFFSGGGFSKTSLALSLNSLSGVGKSYTSTSKGIVSFTAPLFAISSIGLEYGSAHIFLVLGLLLLLSGSLPLLSPSLSSLFNDSLGSVNGHALPVLLLGLGVLSLIKYFFSKKRYIVVNVQGCCYSLSLRGISNKDVEIFIDHTIRLMKASTLSAHAQSQEAVSEPSP